MLGSKYMAQQNKICPYCVKKGHSGFYCRNKPYKPIPKVSKKRLENPAIPKKQKPIKRVGKYGKKWEETKVLWKKENPSDQSGFWYCTIGGAALSDGRNSEASGCFRLNVCHNKSRARSKKLAYDLNNLFPGCPKHNKRQGSKSLEEYLKQENDLKCGNF